MTTAQSFAPVSQADAQLLVLGTMPGIPSLRAAEYYANPRNAFWKIAGEVLGFDRCATYEDRCAALLRRRVALWDVLKRCTREGSLDSAIDPKSIVPNDIAGFLKDHPDVFRICLNGRKAEALFYRQVKPSLDFGGEVFSLPSTSPANAATRYQAKLAHWRDALTWSNKAGAY